MTAPPASAPLALNREVILPPLPSAGLPIVYRIKLTDDEIREMGAAGELHLQLKTDTAAALFVEDEPMELCFRPADKSRPSLEFCLSRRGNTLRSIAPISGEADVMRRMSKGIASITKKRTLEAENASKAHTTQKLNEGEEPRTKRSKERRPPVKRTRVTPSAKPGDVRSSMQGVASMNGASALLNRRLPTLVPSNSPSPQVSPPVNHQLTLGRRVSNGSAGLPPRGTPPPASGVPLSAVPVSLPSANPSPVGPRAATPAKISSAPSSPKVGSMRPKVDIRNDVAHLLALQEMSVTDLTKRLGPGRDAFDEVLKSAKAVGSNGHERGKYKLKPECWADVKPDYAGYSEPERSYIRQQVEKRSKRPANGTDTVNATRRTGLSESGSSGSSSSEGSAVSPSGDCIVGGLDTRKVPVKSTGMSELRLPRLPAADPGLEGYVTDIMTKSDSKFIKPAIQSDEEEVKYRRSFELAWARYCALHSVLEELQNGMSELAEQRKNVSKPSDFDELDDAAASFLKEARDRWDRYSVALSKVHAKVTSLKARIADWSSEAD
jgi:RNA polymerase II elongation factor ELL